MHVISVPFWSKDAVYRSVSGKDRTIPPISIPETAMTTERPDAGDVIPSFKVTTTARESLTNDDLKGSLTVIFFYPKDDTPGCTKEAIGFSERLAAFEALDCTLIGVSKDSLKKHENFKAKHDLNIELASDTDGGMCEAFGVWVEKKLYGRQYMGIERTTFLIGADGEIVKVWRKVRVTDHAQDVLDASRVHAKGA